MKTFKQRMIGQKTFRDTRLLEMKGSVAEGKTEIDIARKHMVNIDDVKKQLAIGESVEMEHTDDPQIAREIAMDHLWEAGIGYYEMLKDMEEKLEQEELKKKTKSTA